MLQVGATGIEEGGEGGGGGDDDDPLLSSPYDVQRHLA
jgi:hypothetical protein